VVAWLLGEEAREVADGRWTKGACHDGQANI
jgi:hypothetical protein